MRLLSHNLSEPVRESVDADLREALELFHRSGESPPSVSLHVFALTGPAPAIAVPSHDVPTAACEPPPTFAARCDWEVRRQSFQLIRENDVVWVIAGDEPGALHGVNEALTCLTGIQWAGWDARQFTLGPRPPWPTGVQSPRVPFRGRNGNGPDEGSRAELIHWMGRNRWNVHRISSAEWVRLTPERRDELIRLYRSRCIQLGLGDHAIDVFLTSADFERHPHWRGMRDGRRVDRAQVVIPECPHLNAELPIQPCFSDERLIETLTDRIVDHMAAFPEVDLFAMWPHDGVNNWCQCERCRATTPYELIHRLAVRLEDKLPSRTMIETIAYSNLLNPPRNELAHVRRTFSLFCPYLRHYRNRVFDEGGPQSPTVGTRYPEPDRINPIDEREYGILFRTWARAWREAGVTPGIFEYTGTFPDETFRTTRPRFGYHPAAELIGAEIDWYIDGGAQVYYLCGPTRCWPDAMHEAALAGALWAGAAAVEPIVTRYYASVAGTFGDELRRSLDAVSDALHEERTPEAELARLSRVLPSVTSPAQRRLYELWIAYTLLACRSRDATVCGDTDVAVEAERLLRDWIDTEGKAAAWAGRISRFRRLSEIQEQRLAERSANRVGSRYVL